MFLPVCYAEVHHKRWFIPNLLWQNEPEIFADFPRRMEPSAKVFPVVLNIKDADAFPVYLSEVSVSFMGKGEKTEILLFKGKKLIKERLLQLLFQADLAGIERPAGVVPVAVKIHYWLKGRKKVVFNHNYRAAPKELWYCNFSEHPLPAPANWYPGDMHWHSSYTEDEIEFGQDPANAMELARVSGMKFLAVTDHSYDLDDVPGHYLEADDSLVKWQNSRKEIQRLNDSNVDFVLIPGEEASLGNAKGRNVHALILDDDEFVPGAGDSADRPFRNRPDNRLEDYKGKGLVIAAHPFEGDAPMPYLFLRRGRWSDDDLKKAHGIEFYNGLKNRGYEKGKAKWIELLLKGEKIFTYGGSDAHGDFIRMFKVKVPFLRLKACDDHLTGNPLTYVYCEKQPNKRLLMDSLRNGHCFVSDGPALELKIRVKKGYLIPGDTYESGGEFSVSVRVVSSPEFGCIDRLLVIHGTCGGEESVTEYQSSDFDSFFEMKIDVEEKGYVRAEVYTDKNRTAFTNPVFFE